MTTEFLFPDESFGYLSNSTYYAADGTFVDFGEGTYSSLDGSTGTFAPATATGSALASDTAQISIKATASNTQSAPQQPLHSGGNNKADAVAASHTSIQGSTRSTSNAGPAQTGQSSQQGSSVQATNDGMQRVSGRLTGWAGGVLIAILGTTLWIF